MQKIIPFLWIDNQAEEAARFYASLFPNSKVLNVSHYGEGMSQPAGTAMDDITRTHLDNLWSHPIHSLYSLVNRYR